MSLLRFDPTTNDWVVFAPSRNLRPHDTHPQAEAKITAPQPSVCPFCPDNEALTPPEIYAVRPGGAGPWRVRVVSNKFPALRIEEDPHRVEDAHGFQYMGGCGAHEVVVESPDHVLALAQQPVDQIDLILHTLQARQRDLMRDHRFQTVVLFKNHGLEAGTSLAHPHWQLIATPVVPRLLRLKHNVASDYFDRTGQCLYCTMVQKELSAGRRVVTTNDHFVAFMPYASHVPFETWIVPRRHQASFSLVENDQLRPLAIILKRVLLMLWTALDNPAFNLTIDAVARGDEDKEYFLWHLRIIPRLTTPAGFELGSGMSINTVLPEEAASFLTEVAIANHLDSMQTPPATIPAS